MIMLILKADQIPHLHEMNDSGERQRRLEPIELPDGRHALNADLLMDLDPGETWWHYRTLLLDLPVETVSEFKQLAV